MNGKRLTRTSIILLCPLIIARAGFGDWFVDDDADPGGDGTEWPEAFIDLQDAFAEAQAGDTIHVARGSYKPTSGTDRSASFELIDNVTLLGGYIGWNEPDPDKRDVDLYTTTLSGDIGTLEDPSDNSYHVVKVTSQADETTIIIDGFTITGGNANSDSPTTDAFGGGMFISLASPIVLRCVFEHNLASIGTPPAFGGGGAVYVHDTVDLEAIVSAPAFFNCVFRHNDGGVVAGGLHNDGGDTLLVNCLFHDNVALFYTGIYNEWTSGLSVPQFVTVINSTIANNVATATGSTGGGIRNEIKMIVINSILWGNEADSSTLEQEQIHGGGSPSEDTFVTYTCIEGLDVFASGEGNIDDDPLFVDDVLENFRISPLSPCRDTGDTATIDDAAYDDVFDLDGDLDTSEPTPDLDLVDRIIDVDVDMGAYEVDCRCPEDLDASDDVGFADLILILDAWGPCPGCPEDLDGNDDVGFADLILVLDAWGPCPCSSGGSTDECTDRDLGANCECRDTLTDLIENGTQAESANARCWLDHYIECHDAQGCNSPADCPDDDPCGKH